MTSSNNGTGTDGSGINIVNVTGGSNLTDVTASGNKRHGLSIGSSNVGVNGGTFNNNGVAGDVATGSGVVVKAESGIVDEVYLDDITANGNTTAGINLSGVGGSVTDVQIGQTTIVNLTDNGSNASPYGPGGAAILIYGSVSGTNITANATSTGALTSTAGLVVVGTDASGTNSPTNTVVRNSNITGYTGGARPAGTMYLNDGGSTTLIGTTNVDATDNNLINGVATGYDVEDALFHKVDNLSLGIFYGPGTRVWVTPNSGSIARGIAIAASPYLTVQVKAGTYNENVVVDKAITLEGDGMTSTIITPAAGNGIAVTSNGVTLRDLQVKDAPGVGIQASGVSNLTLQNVTAESNDDEGINIVNASSVTLDNVVSTNNGTDGDGSGVNFAGVATGSATGVTATGNSKHGFSISGASSNVVVDGGDFSGNGNASNDQSGSGITVNTSSAATPTSITIQGAVTASNNTFAGIFLSAGAFNISGVNIGQTGTVTLSNNGNGTRGAGVIVHGNVANAVITGSFTKGSAKGVGVANLGTDNAGANSPTGTVVQNSTFAGYLSDQPAITLGGVTEGYISTNDVTATNNTFTFPVKVKAFLGGAFSGGSMTTSLNTGGYIPLSQPYSGAPHNYTGTETVVTVPANATDWVLVELRETSGGAAVEQRAAFLQNDGQLIETDGSVGISATTTKATGYDLSYFVVLKHRNHLSIMSAAAVTLPNEASAYDFTTAQAQAFGTSPLADLGSGVFGLFAGEANNSGLVSAADISLAIGALNATGYQITDANMSGLVTAADISVMISSLNKASQLP
ncbi:MAG: right-handed parallel beta-helix repeat-containing protein [Bacteroidetes bacterium]|nr:right-handed parallel beta-helix repeat-containing protein [Bacteroidota bacterium]